MQTKSACLMSISSKSRKCLDISKQSRQALAGYESSRADRRHHLWPRIATAAASPRGGPSGRCPSREEGGRALAFLFFCLRFSWTWSDASTGLHANQ
jgi:hypothetical protein